MTLEERNLLLETVDILRALGGNNGFSNLQPKVKHMLLRYANGIDEIVKRDIQEGSDHTADKADMEMTY